MSRSGHFPTRRRRNGHHIYSDTNESFSARHPCATLRKIQYWGLAVLRVRENSQQPPAMQQENLRGSSQQPAAREGRSVSGEQSLLQPKLGRETRIKVVFLMSSLLDAGRVMRRRISRAYQGASIKGRSTQFECCTRIFSSRGPRQTSTLLLLMGCVWQQEWVELGGRQSVEARRFGRRTRQAASLNPGQ